MILIHLRDEKQIQEKQTQAMSGQTDTSSSLLTAGTDWASLRTNCRECGANCSHLGAWKEGKMMMSVK